METEIRYVVFLRCLNPDPEESRGVQWAAEASYQGTDRSYPSIPRLVDERDFLCPRHQDDEALLSEWGPLKPDTSIVIGPGQPFVFPTPQDLTSNT